jgi:hypothetical protein
MAAIARRISNSRSARPRTAGQHSYSKSVAGVRGSRTHPGLRRSPTTVLKLDDPRIVGLSGCCPRPFRSWNPSTESIQCRHLLRRVVWMGGNRVARLRAAPNTVTPRSCPSCTAADISSVVRICRRGR